KVTIQGEMEEAKFLAKKGPKGTYSHFWISLALQSLKSTIPKIYCSASSTGIGSPSTLASVVINAISNSKSIDLDAPKMGCSAPTGRVWPIGRLMAVPLGTIEELLPWSPTGICSQLGSRAFSLPLNISPTLVACSLLE